MMNRLKALLLAVWRSTSVLLVVVLVLCAFFIGWMVGGPRADLRGPGATAANGPTTASALQEYTCSMHPQVRLLDPDARCPICFMELIPVSAGADSGAYPPGSIPQPCKNNFRCSASSGWASSVAIGR